MVVRKDGRGPVPPNLVPHTTSALFSLWTHVRMALRTYHRAVVAPRWRAWPSRPEEIERCLIATFRIVESMGFKGDFRQGEELLRIGD